jgi:hypothetical protein
MNRCRKKGIAGLLGLAPMALGAHVWERAIPVEPAGHSLAAFRLDSQAVATARFDLTDLRVSDPSNRVIGHEVRPIYHMQRRCDENVLSMERLSARATSPQGFEAIYANLDSETIPTQVQFQIAGEDFEINVSLWTAALPAEVHKASQINLAGLTWEKGVQSEPLYDYSSMLSLRKDKVAWKSEKGRVVKIQVGGLSQSQRSTLATLSGRLGRPSEETFQITTRLMRVESMTFTGMVCREAALAQALDTVELMGKPDWTPSPEAGAQRSWYRVRSGGLPLQSLIFKVAPGNLMRTVRVTGWPDSTRRGLGDSAKPWTWPVLAEGQMRRIDWGESRDSLFTVALSLGERMRDLAIGVHDRDDPPLLFLGVQGVWGRQHVFFPVAQDGLFHLRYGLHGIPAVRSEFNAMFERVADPEFLLTSLGEPQLIDPVGTTPAKSWMSGSTLMGIGLGVGILTLMALLIGVARKAKALT